jgi:hypothetical protein
MSKRNAKTAATVAKLLDTPTGSAVAVVPATGSAVAVSPAAKPSLLGGDEAAVAQFWALAKAKPALPFMEDAFDLADKGKTLVALGNRIGTADTTFLATLLDQLMMAAGGSNIAVAEKGLNSALAVMMAFEPRTPAEGLLAAQMAATHNATLDMARRLADAKDPAWVEAASGMFNKLARTFCLQLETLKKLRSNGVQVVQHQHIAVADGGQAVVAGQLRVGGGDATKIGGQPHETLGCDAVGPALLGNLEADAQALPAGGGAGLERLQGSRSARRRAKG